MPTAMTMQPSLDSMYQAFIAQCNSASTTPINSSPHDNSIPKSNSRLPDERSPTELLLLYYKAIRRFWPVIAPSSWYQTGPSPGLGRVVFIFGQNIDELRNETPLDQLTGWTAQLDLVTRDLPSMMRNGLFLTWENVRQGENHVKRTHTEGIGWLNLRCYTVASSTWSGSLKVCAASVKPVTNFRLHHLSADKAFLVYARNHESHKVYHYDAFNPEDNANYLYDDMPLDGLWPWPKKEGEERVREGEEITKGEVEGDRGENKAEMEETELEEEETDCFSAWGSEDSLIGPWRD